VNSRILSFLTLVLLSSCSGNVIQTAVFSDGFENLEPGIIPFPEKPDPAIYYQPGMGTLGDWTIATSLRQEGFNQAWEVRHEGGKKVLVQSYSNLDAQNEPLSLVTHPIIVAGDSLWKDFTIEVDFTPLAKFDKCGIVFGYQHPNDFYFFGTEGNTVILKRVLQSVSPLRPIEQILAYRPLVWTPGEQMRAMVTVRRNNISTILNDSIRMYEGMEVFRPGKIGLISDLPAIFSRVEVNLLKGEQRKMNRKQRQQQRRQELHLDGHPSMVRWKALDIKAFGSDQNVRLGDLTGDGNKELLFVRSRKKGKGIACITAANLDGRLLWQYGDPSLSFNEMGGEIPVQIHDVDGDGQREVIFVSGETLYMLGGRKGEVLKSARLPEGMTVRALAFADLEGRGWDHHLVMTDRESLLAVYDENLEVQWLRRTDNSSQPLIHDMDKDGVDEILVGYSAFDHQGELIFNIGEFIGDKCNGISLFELEEDNGIIPCIVYAAGDWGLLYADYEGNILRQTVLGHVNYLTVADFDTENPGLELVTSNRWGSDGLIHVTDARGRIKKHFTAESGPSRCIPVNWKGDGEEFMLLSADTLKGGMFDKWGQLSVKFPADDHPVLCHMVQDLNGDARDEVLVWDRNRLWIYSQDDNPRMGNTYSPDRYPLYNFSMHNMAHSLPGW
jgi:rhamnogalacturonan endolyase